LAVRPLTCALALLLLGLRLFLFFFLFGQQVAYLLPTCLLRCARLVQQSTITNSQPFCLLDSLRHLCIRHKVNMQAVIAPAHAIWAAPAMRTATPSSQRMSSAALFSDSFLSSCGLAASGAVASPRGFTCCVLLKGAFTPFELLLGSAAPGPSALARNWLGISCEPKKDAFASFEQ
jgi:hypothetical protein